MRVWKLNYRDINNPESGLEPLVCKSTWLGISEDCVPCIPGTLREGIYSDGLPYKSCFVGIDQDEQPSVWASWPEANKQSNVVTLKESVIFEAPEPVGLHAFAAAIAAFAIIRNWRRRDRNLS